MSEALVPAAAATSVVANRGGELVLPQMIVDAGAGAVGKYLEFFAGRIANARTRAAYGRAVGQFLTWCEDRGLGLGAIRPRATWPPTSGPTPARSRPSSSTWPPSACSATGSSSARSFR